MAALRLGIVGLGRGATLTAPAFVAHPRIELVAGADPDEAARKGFTRQTGACTYPDIAQMLADQSIDAVYVASPHELHADHTVAALAAGKHVLVEKPMAVTLLDACRMVRAADESGTVLMVGPSHGYDPQLALAAALMAGSIGPARLIHALNFTDFLDRPRRDAELDRDRGGGVVFSQASHQIDIVRRLADSPVASVRGWVGGWHDRHATDGAYTAMLTFENGAAASLTYSGHGRYNSDALAGSIGEMGQSVTLARAPRSTASEEGLQRAKAARGFAGAPMTVAAPLHHERFGFVVASCANGDLEITPDGITVHDADGTTLHPAPLPPVQRYGVADAFARAALDGAASGFDGRWGLETLACCHAIVRSAREGRDVAPADLLETA